MPLLQETLMDKSGCRRASLQTTAWWLLVRPYIDNNFCFFRVSLKSISGPFPVNRVSSLIFHNETEPPLIALWELFIYLKPSHFPAC